MSVIQCPQGHYYDNGKYQACPHCAAGGLPGGRKLDGHTVFKPRDHQQDYPTTPEPPQRKVLAFQGVQNKDEKTVGLFLKKKGYDPVSGWLVCIDGPEKGRDYRLHMGRNFIGRSPTMDVSVADDPLISRENHASLVYEPMKSTYALVPGDGTEVAVNGQKQTQSCVLQDGDTVVMGSSTFVFIPFCKGEFKW